jgi:IS605 OrfB family transposase
MVGTAQRTARRIALEDLKGMRERISVRRTVQRQRRALHGWAFCQPRAFIAYKAAAAGVRVVLVDPAYTSQTWSHCRHCEKANRKSRARFLCVSCGFSARADLNAAANRRFQTCA